MIVSRAPADGQAPRTPRHLWLVAGLGFVWYALGCADYLLTNLRIPVYLAQFPPEMIDFIDALPGWAICTWAVSVGLGLLGCGQLLERTRLALYAFALSLAALAAGQFNQFATGLPAAMDTPVNRSITVAVWLVAIGLQVYAVWMRRRGVLR